MKAAIILVALAAIACAEEAAAPAAASPLVKLTTADFAEKTKEGVWMIKFFAPWCGHCKRLAPAWLSLAATAAGKFNVAEVDCTVEKDVCKAQDVHGYPTVKLFDNGSVKPYNGQRIVKAFLAFVAENVKSVDLSAVKDLPEVAAEAEPAKPAAAPAAPAAQPAAPAAGPSEVVVLKQDNFDQTIAKGPCFVKFFAPWCGHCKHLAPIWEQVAREQKGVFTVAEVDATVETALATRFNVDRYPTLIMFVNGKQTPYNGGRTAEEIATWAKQQIAAPKEEEVKQHSEV